MAHSLMFGSFGDTGLAEPIGSTPTNLDVTAERAALQNEAPWLLFIRQVVLAGVKMGRKRFTSTGTVVGHGRHSEVYRYLVSDRHDMIALTSPSSPPARAGSFVALKRVQPMADGERARVLRAIANEVHILTRPALREHDFIVRFQALVWEDHGGGPDEPHWPTLITEYCDCTLQELLAAHRLGLEAKCWLLIGIGEALETLWQQGYVHGDIKCENILIQFRGNNVIVPKLSDFGSSISYEDAEEAVILGGTDPWRAPEVCTAGCTPGYSSGKTGPKCLPEKRV
jgi:serine/threonine protein kinase